MRKENTVGKTKVYRNDALILLIFFSTRCHNVGSCRCVDICVFLVVFDFFISNDRRVVRRKK